MSTNPYEPPQSMEGSPRGKYARARWAIAFLLGASYFAGHAVFGGAVPEYVACPVGVAAGLVLSSEQRAGLVILASGLGGALGLVVDALVELAYSPPRGFDLGPGDGAFVPFGLIVAAVAGFLFGALVGSVAVALRALFQRLVRLQPDRRTP